MLVAIPAYNEEATIGEVVRGVRATMPEVDLLVVNDGSTDATKEVLAQLRVPTATHLCNLGYSRTIQTILKYARHHKYEAVLTLDADGQHRPEQIREMVQAFQTSNLDLMIGSRYVKTRDYSGEPLGRRLGMQLFSTLVALLGHKRIYDTSSGMKIFRSTVYDSLLVWHFVDFHAEAILYLMHLGYEVGEYPIVVATRKHGISMYTRWSYLRYPVKVMVMLMLGVVEATLLRRGRG